MDASTVTPQDVLSFWFFDDLEQADPERYAAYWQTVMRGGMDDAIIGDWGPVTEAAARGLLDHWAETPYGRLALILTLDQFPRSYWRDTPGAYAQDIKTTRLALEGLENGHYDALKWAWEKNFYLIAISHCEGPDHLQRMHMLMPLAQDMGNHVPDRLRENAKRTEAQITRVTGIIERFGRHPHRNGILGRISTPEEEIYIAEGDFPHESNIEPPAT